MILNLFNRLVQPHTVYSNRFNKNLYIMLLPHLIQQGILLTTLVNLGYTIF